MIKINIKLLIVTTLAFTISGCTLGPKSLYEYGDYSQSYYDSKKNINEESSLNLQKSIEEAIEKADQSTSNRVPPGMYANLGYIYLKSGNPDKAIANFEKEKFIYPESTHFMNRLIKKVELAEGEKK